MNDSKNGNIDKAISRVEEARALAPDFWEVSRVEAFIISTRNPELASLKFAEAYRMAQGPEERAITAFYFGGHLARSEKDLEGALPYHKEAHSWFSNPTTARALASNLVWLGRHDEGIELFELSRKSATGKDYVITASLLVDAFRRRADYHQKESQSLVLAWQDCLSAWAIGSTEIQRGTTDGRLIDNLLKSVSDSLLIVRRSMSAGHQLAGVNEYLSELASAAAPLCSRGSDEIPYTVRRLRSIEQDPDLGPAAALVLEAFRRAGLPDIEWTGNDRVADVHEGALERDGGPGEPGEITMISSARGFGFIRTPTIPTGVFFHASKVRNPLSFKMLQVGQRVRVEVEEISSRREGAPKAIGVYVVNSDMLDHQIQSENHDVGP